MPHYDGEHEDKSFEPIPNGSYPFEVVDANEINEDQIVLDLTIDVGRAKPFKRKQWLTFTEKAMWAIVQFLDSVGLQDLYTKSEGYIKASLEADDCIGLSGMLELKEGEGDDGKMYSNIERFIPPEGFTEQPVSKANQARAAKIANAKAAAQHEKTASKPSPGDDVPF